jgi:hypothetical protein
MSALKVFSSQIYGKLTVVERVENSSDGRPRFLCSCKCGAQKVVRGDCLRHGNTRSCGCIKKEKSRLWAPVMVRNHVTKPAGVSALMAAFCATRQSARVRRLLFDLTLEKFKSLIQQPCTYCGAAPSNSSKTTTGIIKWSGIDRVDSKAGYVAGNVVPCCKICNRAKGSMSVSQFLSYAKQLYQKCYGPEEKT